MTSWNGNRTLTDLTKREWGEGWKWTSLGEVTWEWRYFWSPAGQDWTLRPWTCTYGKWLSGSPAATQLCVYLPHAVALFLLLLSCQVSSRHLTADLLFYSFSIFLFNLWRALFFIVSLFFPCLPIFLLCDLHTYFHTYFPPMGCAPPHIPSHLIW